MEGQNKINDHNERYVENIRSLDKCIAIVDINYPHLSESISNLYGQANKYWRHRWMFLINKDKDASQENSDFCKIYLTRFMTQAWRLAH